MSETAGVEVIDVVVIGAGVAGLTVASLLQRSGVGCVVLERHDRSYVEQRQRVGVLDYRAEQVYVRGGLDERLLNGVPPSGAIEIRIDGVGRLFDGAVHTGGRSGRLLSQQLLVQRLIALFLDGGGDLRFDAADVALHGVDGDRPWVSYRDAAGGNHRLDCRYVAGCDGFHGVSRASLPADLVTTYEDAESIGWFTVLTDSPPPRHALFGVSRHGFAAQFARGRTASRFYLQCGVGDSLQQWSDERVWQQLRLRLGDEQLPSGPIVDKSIIDARGIVIDPMAHGRLFLAGDAAHIITPMGGKGMNLAIADAGVLAEALYTAIQHGDEELLRSYSATCLPRVWSDQEFSRWMSEMMFHAGDIDTAGPFRWQLARARLDRLFTCTTAAAAFAAMLAGT